MEEVNVGEKIAGKGILETFAPLYYAIFRTPSLRKFLKFFGNSIASLDLETVQLPSFSILSAMFTGACGPPEKLRLALMSCSNVLCMIVKLAYYVSIPVYDLKPWPNGLASRRKSTQVCKTRTCVRTCEGWPNGFTSRKKS